MVSMKSNLQKLIDRLEERIGAGRNVIYNIPEIWDTFGYSGKEKKHIGKKLITVNPYGFILECIRKTIISDKKKDIDYSLSIATHEDDHRNTFSLGGDWIQKSSMYSTHIRTSTSWDHDSSRQLEFSNTYGFKDTGTFLKTIILLPLLKKMGIDTLYMLPVTMTSSKFMKGEMGSPYAVKDFLKLDPNLKDPMLGDDFSIDDEFAALVEACHVVGIKVVIDIIPRTSARDCNLIMEHPEWFYWVKCEGFEGIERPKVSSQASEEDSLEQYLSAIYNSPEVIEYLSKFSDSPDKLDPAKWNKIKERYNNDESFDFFEAIKEEFGIITPPAYSNYVGDLQAPWSDITFLRFYLDHPVSSKQYLRNSEQQAPYMLYDVIVSSKYPGEVRNQELWDYIAGIIPYYQKRFGVDGARIDMGYTLPAELVAKILEEARKVSPEFCFVSETFHYHLGEETRNNGYNAMLGDASRMEIYITEMDFNESMQGLCYCPIYTLATAETSDTPRAVTQKGGKRYSKFTAVLNNFLPNMIPFVCSGFEIYERQPLNPALEQLMNYGSNATFTALPEDDPFYGKLAFYDKFALHWAQDGVEEIPSILSEVSAIRRKYLNSLLNAQNYASVYFDGKEGVGIGLAYLIDQEAAANRERILLVAGNADFENSAAMGIWLGNLFEKAGSALNSAQVVFSEDKDVLDKIFLPEGADKLTLSFKPGEIKIIILQN